MRVAAISEPPSEAEAWSFRGVPAEVAEEAGLRGRFSDEVGVLGHARR